MKYSSVIFDGEFYSCYWCEICDAFMEQCPDSSENGIAFMEFKYEEEYRKFKDNILLYRRIVLFEKVSKQ